ncbi:MAG: SUF system Fe-S cluster assembly protein [Vicinamibacterales bacterium]
MFSFFRKKGPAALDEPRPVAEGARPPQPAPAGDALDVSALVAPGPAAAAPSVTSQPPADPELVAALRPKVVEAISTVFDPEIPVNIYELGLIYDVEVRADASVAIKMTLTSPACPSAQQLPSEVEWKAKAVEGVSDAKVEIVWEPPWSSDRMSEAARLQLGLL